MELDYKTEGRLNCSGFKCFASINAEKEAFEQKCYELYRLEWMMSHGYSVVDFFDQIKRSIISQVADAECPYSITTQTQAENAMQCAYEEFDENGFGSGNLWVCIDEFLGAEYRDAAYMKWLFETQVDTEADKLKAMAIKTDSKTDKNLKEIGDHY